MAQRQLPVHGKHEEPWVSHGAVEGVCHRALSSNTGYLHTASLLPFLMVALMYWGPTITLAVLLSDVMLDSPHTCTQTQGSTPGGV